MICTVSRKRHIAGIILSALLFSMCATVVNAAQRVEQVQTRTATLTLEELERIAQTQVPHIAVGKKGLQCFAMLASAVVPDATALSRSCASVMQGEMLMPYAQYVVALGQAADLVSRSDLSQGDRDQMNLLIQQSLDGVQKVRVNIGSFFNSEVECEKELFICPDTRIFTNQVDAIDPNTGMMDAAFTTTFSGEVYMERSLTVQQTLSVDRICALDPNGTIEICTDLCLDETHTFSVATIQSKIPGAGVYIPCAVIDVLKGDLCFTGSLLIDRIEPKNGDAVEFISVCIDQGQTLSVDVIRPKDPTEAVLFPQSICLAPGTTLSVDKILPKTISAGLGTISMRDDINDINLIIGGGMTMNMSSTVRIGGGGGANNDGTLHIGGGGGIGADGILNIGGGGAMSSVGIVNVGGTASGSHGTIAVLGGGANAGLVCVEGIVRAEKYGPKTGTAVMFEGDVCIDPNFCLSTDKICPKTNGGVTEFCGDVLIGAGQNLTVLGTFAVPGEVVISATNDLFVAPGNCITVDCIKSISGTTTTEGISVTDGFALRTNKIEAVLPGITGAADPLGTVVFCSDVCIDPARTLSVNKICAKDPNDALELCTHVCIDENKTLSTNRIHPKTGSVITIDGSIDLTAGNQYKIDGNPFSLSDLVINKDLNMNGFDILGVNGVCIDQTLSVDKVFAKTDQNDSVQFFSSICLDDGLTLSTNRICAKDANDAVEFCSHVCIEANKTLSVNSIHPKTGSLVTIDGNLGTVGGVVAGTGVVATLGGVTALAGDVTAVLGDINAGNDVNAVNNVCVGNTLFTNDIAPKGGPNVSLGGDLNVIGLCIDGTMSVNKVFAKIDQNDPVQFCSSICLDDWLTLSTNRICAKDANDAVEFCSHVCIEANKSLSVNSIHPKTGSILTINGNLDTFGDVTVLAGDVNSSNDVNAINNVCVGNTLFTNTIAPKGGPTVSLGGDLNVIGLCIDGTMSVNKVFAKSDQNDPVQFSSSICLDDGLTLSTNRICAKDINGTVTFCTHVCIEANKTLSVDKISQKTANPIMVDGSINLLSGNQYLINGMPLSLGGLVINNDIDFNNQDIFGVNGLCIDGTMSVNKVFAKTDQNNPVQFCSSICLEDGLTLSTNRICAKDSSDAIDVCTSICIDAGKTLSTNILAAKSGDTLFVTTSLDVQGDMLTNNLCVDKTLSVDIIHPKTLDTILMSSEEGAIFVNVGVDQPVDSTQELTVGAPDALSRRINVGNFATNGSSAINIGFSSAADINFEHIGVFSTNPVGTNRLLLGLSSIAAFNRLGIGTSSTNTAATNLLDLGIGSTANMNQLSVGTFSTNTEASNLLDLGSSGTAILNQLSVGRLSTNISGTNILFVGESSPALLNSANIGNLSTNISATNELLIGFGSSAARNKIGVGENSVSGGEIIVGLPASGTAVEVSSDVGVCIDSSLGLSTDRICPKTLDGAINFCGSICMDDGLTLSTNRICAKDASTDFIDICSTVCVDPNFSLSVNTIEPCSGSSITITATIDVLGDIKVDGVVAIISDGRIKKNVKSIEPHESLERINKLQPRTYKFTPEFAGAAVEDQAVQRGFVAQELQEVMPELILTSEHKTVAGKQLDNFLSVDYARLAVDLVGAVQATHAELLQAKTLNAQQAEQIDELTDFARFAREQIETLSKQVAALQR